jgi:cytochrome c
MNVRMLWIAVCLGASACGGKTESKNEEEYVANGTEQPAEKSQVTLGEELVRQNDCNTCHHKTNTLIGPSHTAVAQKYEFSQDNVKLLAEKITKGGSGVWGQIPMAAHVGLSQADAEAMARYVLSLDGEKEH